MRFINAIITDELHRLAMENKTANILNLRVYFKTKGANIGKDKLIKRCDNIGLAYE